MQLVAAAALGPCEAETTQPGKPRAARIGTLLGTNLNFLCLGFLLRRFGFAEL